MEGRVINKLSINDYIKYNNSIYIITHIGYTRSKPRQVSVTNLMPPFGNRTIDYYDMKHACEWISPDSIEIQTLLVLYGSKTTD
jgi:hypothetical protein